MTKRRRLCIAICILSLAIAGGLVLAIGLGNRGEPVYQGKTLSLWLDDYYNSSYSSGTRRYDPAAVKAAEEAVRQIGTNGIPTLLRMIKAQNPSPVMRKVLGFARNRRLEEKLYPRSAFQRHLEASFAFRILRTNAACAVPELIRICKEPRYPTSQASAADALGDVGPAAKAAIPLLLRHFTHTNAEVRIFAVSAVHRIGGDPSIVVPAMKRMLKDPEGAVRSSAVAALERVRSAIPELLEVLHDQDPEVREQVENALWNLAPEKVAQPIVVEDATPMVANGVTTEAFSHEAYGQFWTIIPQGKSGRCVVYQSVITPLYLYRGVTLTSTNDHFLGRFEVANIPTNSSVEVACIIDHQQILLCARDYNRKQFVELRRVDDGAK
jgi:HEAT repeats